MLTVSTMLSGVVVGKVFITKEYPARPPISADVVQINVPLVFPEGIPWECVVDVATGLVGATVSITFTVRVTCIALFPLPSIEL